MFHLQYRFSTEEKGIDGASLLGFAQVRVRLSERYVLTAVLALIEARGAADLVGTLF